MTHPALAAAVTAAREFADAMEKAHAALAPEPEPSFKRGDRVITRDVEFSNRRQYIGQEATVADTPFGASTLYGVATADGSYVAATRVEKVSDDPTPDPTPTRVEIRTTDDRERVVFAELGIYGEGSVFISVKDHDSRSAAWLSREEARQLAATLTAIADTP